ncbi:MAG: homoserine O-acetyltransferase [Pelagibacterales bacterium]|nr:homoserine O-acetyltransferase [Pelagibacterales bacterium]
MIFDKTKIKNLNIKNPLQLESGKILSEYSIAYETFGELNSKKNNAILVFHALSGDQFVTGTHPITNKEGWWVTAVGPSLAIDTNKYFVICANVLGGCMGSSGPSTIDPTTKEIYGLKFPLVTIKDIVNSQINLLDHFGIDKVLAVIGGSMGGMQALQFCSSYPNRTHSAIPIACTASHSAQNIAFNELARQAIMADPDWSNGDYIKNKKSPEKGLSVARMAGHISYLSEVGLQNKFGRKLQNTKDFKFSFDADFQIESYLKHQGKSFVERFDANTYLYVSRAMDYFDLYRDNNGNLSNAFKNTKIKFCLISFTSDWLYPTSEIKKILIALNSIGADVGFVEIDTNNGHDSFLVHEPEFLKTVRGFLDSAYNKVLHG